MNNRNNPVSRLLNLLNNRSNFSNNTYRCYVNDFINYLKENEKQLLININDDIVTTCNLLIDSYQRESKNIQFLKKFLNKISTSNTVIEELDEILEEEDEVDDFDNTTQVIYQRGLNSDKIKSYKIIVARKDNPIWQVILTREEMEEIFGLYTYYGGNVTARNVSQEFPKFTLQEIKRILRAFKITKDSEWFPPHLKEELTIEQLGEYRLNFKTKAAFKYADASQERDFKNVLNKTVSQINKLKGKLSNAEELCNYKNSNYWDLDKNITDGSALVVYLSDMHIGAYNDSFGVYDNPYNKEEIKRRLLKVIDRCINDCHEELYIINLGDSIDSYNKQTTRGGHDLPSLFNNKEMSKLYLEVMNEFFNTLLHHYNPEQINYFCVGESNHDGDWGWINNIALANQIQQKGINTYVSDKHIDYLNIWGNKFVFLHGKDNNSMFRNFPLTLNDKVENYFNEFLDEYKITAEKDIYIVKGDLHQSAETVGKRFTYKSVGSLYGSSNWICANFGFTKWRCDYSIVKKDEILNGVIKD